MNKIPAPPWLTKEAKKIWNQKIKEVRSADPDLSQIDFGALAHDCKILAEVQDLNDKIKKIRSMEKTT